MLNVSAVKEVTNIMFKGRNHRSIAVCLIGFFLGTAAVAKPQEKPEAPAQPLQKGYDDSFQTGDIPKPTTPEMDPENVTDDELNPDQVPDRNPMNDPELDREPRDFRVGATASLALPHMLNFALESLIGSNMSVALNYGNVTRSLSNVDVSLKHQDIRFRWFPYSSSFFVGIGLGQHQLTGELDRNITIKGPDNKDIAVAARGKLSASAKYAVPHVGWFSVWESGFVVGFDVGYLFPTDTKSSFSHTFKNPPAGSEGTLVETPEFKKLKNDLEDSAKKHASRPAPFTSLLRLGWMF